MRKTLTIIQDLTTNFIHFTSVCSGVNGDAWYPLNGVELFEKVESLLVLSGDASNVVSVEELRQCGDSKDFLVTYNEAELENLKITQNISEDEQCSSFQNATLSGHNENIAVSIATYPEKANYSSQDELELLIKSALTGLANKGWDLKFRWVNHHNNQRKSV